MDSSIKILIIDDEEPIRSLLAKIIDGLGVTFSAAASGQEGIEKLKNEKYALLICDVRMPGMDGIAVLKQAKKMDTEIEVIMISGFGSAETIVQSLKISAFDFISKPFNVDDIEAAVNSALKSYLLKKSFYDFKTEIKNAAAEFEKIKTSTKTGGEQTAKKIAALRESYRKTIYDSLDPVISLNLKKDVVAWNKKAESVFGYEAVKVIGKPVDFLFSYDKDIPGSEFWAEVEQKGVVRDFITKCFTSNNEVLYVVITAFLFENEEIIMHLRKSRLIVY